MPCTAAKSGGQCLICTVLIRNSTQIDYCETFLYNVHVFIMWLQDWSSVEPRHFPFLHWVRGENMDLHTYVCEAKYIGIRVIAEGCFMIWDILGWGEWGKLEYNDCPCSNSHRAHSKSNLPMCMQSKGKHGSNRKKQLVVFQRQF